MCVCTRVNIRGHSFATNDQTSTIILFHYKSPVDRRVIHVCCRVLIIHVRSPQIVGTIFSCVLLARIRRRQSKYPWYVGDGDDE